MKPLFIAEIGLNHQGNLSKAFRMVRLAKEAGANIAKFQYYDPIRLLGSDYEGLDSIIHCQFNKPAHERLANYCNELDIEYLVSVFDIKDISWADSLCKRHKVASRMNRDLEFLSYIDKTKKPVIMSIQPELPLRSCYRDRWYFMWCTQQYPASYVSVTKHPFSYKYGLSSHCPDYTASVEAYKAGARIFENHIKEFESDEGVDMTSSLLLTDYRKMIDEINAQTLDISRR